MKTELTASKSLSEGRRDRLVKELRSVVADADVLLKDMTSSSAEEFAAARTKVEGSLSEARARLAETRVRLTEKAKGAARDTDEYVKEHPWKAMGIAAAAGLAASYLLRRH